MTVLLIDGDILAYRAALAAQNLISEPRIDAFGYAWAFASMAEGKAVLDNMLSRLVHGLGGTSTRIFLSHPLNWRHEILPSYKANRAGLSRPLLLTDLKEYLEEHHGAERVPYLEADDLVGIAATSPGFSGIIVGCDKDFAGIPGRHHTLGDTTADRMRVVEVAAWQAERQHLIQTLAGDRVDGYGGCPGLGMERAAKIIDNPQRLVPKPGVITSGKNKGQPTERWFAEPTTDYWACIVSHYRKAGLTEADALVTARVAKILHYEDYDMKTGQVTLWTPERLRR